ncbi:Deoxyribonuclease NucA/NucB [Paenibacillus sp. yr247]|nr:Deoxyribonuclease NucA/NucB [Paenibacillus sp. yr247]
MLENAQENGHSLENLQRGGGTREAQKNRYEAQKQIRKEQGPPPEGHDYDEFPYASTKQGGAGAHVEPVPSEENQAVGRDLGQFYKKNGINENDSFDIKITD